MINRKALDNLSIVALNSLNFLLVHLRKVADDPNNKMGVKNLATVFSPSLVIFFLSNLTKSLANVEHDL